MKPVGKVGGALAITIQIILLMSEVIQGIEELINKINGSKRSRKPSNGGKGNHSITKVGVICYFDTDVFKGWQEETMIKVNKASNQDIHFEVMQHVLRVRNTFIESKLQRALRSSKIIS